MGIGEIPLFANSSDWRLMPLVGRATPITVDCDVSSIFTRLDLCVTGRKRV
jgi:hypothetical protein